MFYARADHQSGRWPLIAKVENFAQPKAADKAHSL